MTATVDELDETLLDGEPLCQFMIEWEKSEGACGNVARWMAVHQCPACRKTGRTLTCDRCKEQWDQVSHKYAMICPPPCGTVSPADTVWEKL